MLVAANRVPLAGVLFFGWSVFATVLLFWLENVILGAFNVLRMAWAQPENPVSWLVVMTAALVLLVSHGFSFLFNYFGAGEYRTAQLNAPMGRPYGRVVVLHLAILGGGFLVLTLGSPLVPLALLVLLKTGLDLRAHVREHASRSVDP